MAKCSYEKLNLTLVLNLKKKIEDLKKSEENLKKQKLFIESVIENIPDMIFVKDAKHFRFEEMNKAGEVLLGLKKQDILGKDLLDKFSKSQADFFLSKDKEVIKSGKLLDISEEFIDTPKGVRILHTKKIPIFDEKHNPLYLLGISEDITERKRAEEKIRESENKFKTIFENARDGILAVDAEIKKFVFANLEICKLTGYTEKELLQLNIADIHPKKDLPYVIDQFTKQMQGKISLAKDMPILRKDKNVIYCDINASGININGRGLLVGFFRNVTEKKKAEEKIKESESRYKTLFDLSSDAIMTLAAPDWRFTSGNLAALKMFNAKDEQDFISKGPGEVSPKYQPSGQLSSVKAKKMIMKAMKTGSNFFEWTHKRIKGEDFPATVLLSRIELNGKKLLQATVRDVSKLKKAEQKLLLQKEKTRIEIERYKKQIKMLKRKRKCK